MGAIKATNSETVVGLDLMLVLSRLSHDYLLIVEV